MSTAEERMALDPDKFRDPLITAKGEKRAHVTLTSLETLWINTGTLCNIACANCYIESSPKNDRLVYISAPEVAAYLDEVQGPGNACHTIGFTGGEPFMNPDFIPMLEDALGRGFACLVLTNAMKPLWHKREALRALRDKFSDQLTIRVSVDHYTSAVHEMERGPNSWAPMVKGLEWLSANGFRIAIAGRNLTGETDAALRAGFAGLMAECGLDLDADDPGVLVIFPEMDGGQDVPEITEQCWDILSVSPAAQMCATERMIVKRKGAARPNVVACTLLPYEEQFSLGTTLGDATRRVSLNHPHCATFCVLGGASCSAG